MTLAATTRTDRRELARSATFAALLYIVAALSVYGALWAMYFITADGHFAISLGIAVTKAFTTGAPFYALGTVLVRRHAATTNDE